MQRLGSPCVSGIGSFSGSGTASPGGPASSGDPALPVKELWLNEKTAVKAVMLFFFNFYFIYHVRPWTGDGNLRQAASTSQFVL